MFLLVNYESSDKTIVEFYVNIQSIRSFQICEKESKFIAILDDHRNVFRQFNNSGLLSDFKWSLIQKNIILNI